jgi:hypothetical protein
MVFTILFWYTSIKRNNGFSSSRFNNAIKEFKIPYSHLNDESKARIASHEEKLDTILSYYEDLECPDVDEIISERGTNTLIDSAPHVLRNLTLTLRAN